MIHTERCTLSALRKSDLDPLIRLHTNPDVRRYLGGPQGEAVARRRCKWAIWLTNLPKWIAARQNSACWAIRPLGDDTFMGIVTLDPHHDGTDVEISYLLLPEWWGQGYATEAVQSIIDHGLNALGLPRIIAETQTANAASIRLLERVGMTFERTVERFGAEQSIYTT